MREKRVLQESEYFVPYHYLDIYSEEYLCAKAIMYRGLLKTVKESILPNSRLLDVGCGDGRFCYELKDLSVEATGIDLCERAINFARIINPDANYIAGDIGLLSDSVPYDHITLIETLEHIPPEDVAEFLSKINPLLAKGGTLIVTVPSVNLPLQEKHYRHFTEETLRNELSPYFNVKDINGYWRKDIVFDLIRYFLAVSIPLRNKLRFIKSLCKYAERYYEKKLKIGNPSRSYGLVAVCEKKKSDI